LCQIAGSPIVTPVMIDERRRRPVNTPYPEPMFKPGYGIEYADANGAPIARSLA